MLSALFAILGGFEASTFTYGQVIDFLQRSTRSLDLGLGTCLLWFQVYDCVLVTRWNWSIKGVTALATGLSGVWDQELDT
jgi:hypothetical protein